MTNNSMASWQRLSPVAIVYYLFKTAKEIISNALQSLAPLMIVVLSADDKSRMIVLVGILLSCILLLSAILQYWFFRYSLDNEAIRIHQGVFKKQHRVINFDRVQNININQPFYFRPFALVSLMIETAGSSGDEGTLAGINQTQAATMRDHVLQQQRDIKSTIESDNSNAQSIAAENPEETDTTLLASATIKDIIRYGLSNNGAYIILALLAPFYRVIKQKIGEFTSSEQFQVWYDFFPDKFTGTVVLALLSILAVLVLLTGFSIIGALLNFHGYRLTAQKTTLKRKSGLINTHEESLNLNKVQAIRRQCNFIGRLLGIENMVLRQASTASAGGGQKQKGNQAQFIIPARTPKQSEQLISILYPDNQDPDERHRISQRYILKTLMVNWTLPLCLVCLPFYFASDKIEFLYALILPLLLLPLIYQRWRKYRYSLTAQYGLIETGLFGYRYVLFPLFKVQRVTITQALWQKPAGLANLTIYLASGSISIPYMPIKHARQWFDQIYHKIETDQRPWF